MKSLDSLLQSLRLRSHLQNRIVLNEPWGVSFPSDPKRRKFHYMEGGEGILDVPGQAPVRLRQGDFALVRMDTEHHVYDVNGSPATAVDELVRKADILCRSGITLRFGGDGAESSVITGDFLLDDAATHPLWRSLPPAIVLRGEEGEAVEWLETTLAFVSCEATSVRPGATAVLDRLCDVLFIQALRGWVQQAGKGEGWPAAVRDPMIDEALDQIHLRPHEPWTVARLADGLAMSRSSFAERFRQALGESPMGYLSRWRMHIAANMLRQGPEPVATIAQRVGYESEAAFAKAFKRMIGVAPGAYRRSTAN